MPRLVPARWIAALRPDDTAPMELPGDVARESRRRVRVAALLGALGYGTYLLLLLSGLVRSRGPQRPVDLAHDVVGLVLCLILLVVASARRIPDRHVLRTAMVVQVLVVSLIAIGATWAGFLRTAHNSYPGWLVPVILLFPLLVPLAPRTTLLLSTLCALMMPAAFALLELGGVIRVDASDYWNAFATGAVAVAIATIASRTLYGARRQVAAARMLGSYELIDRLGQGGMGEVWRARHQLLARPAAVKLILPDSLRGPSEEREEVVKRFLREAQVTASLCSPHTVQLFDFGVDAEGTFYYAMELLDGMNIEEFIYRFGPIEPRRAVHWLRQACHSLGEAHARNLVHRDIKPANLFVCRYGRDADFVKILDFGLSRAPAATGAVALTRPGSRMGTPGYMAPEQVFDLAVDPRTDLYALGCVAYWLLAGEKPFESDNAGELMRQHAQASPPLLSSRAAQPVPPRLEQLVMSCLSKDPLGRPASADDLRDGLERAVEDEPWSEADAARWWAAHVDAR